MNILAKLGLIKLSEHEAKVSGLEFRLETYGNALRNRTTELNTCGDQLAEMDRENKRVKYDLARARNEAEALRHDAQKWRDKLARDRAARKGVVS